MKGFTIILLVLVGCTKPQMDDCITSLGKEKVAIRNVSSFSHLFVEDRIQVILVQDSSKVGVIELIGPQNLLDEISTDINQKRLEIRNKNTCNFVRSFNYTLKAIVYISDLVSIEVQSIATITNEGTLRLERLDIYHRALSDVNLMVDCKNEIFVQSHNSATTILRGKARVLKGSIEEVSSLDARDLQCEEVLVDTHTPLDCYVNATKGLFIKIYNSGNIYYTQEPTDYKDLNERLGAGNLLLL